MTRIPQLLGANETDWQRMIDVLHVGVGTSAHDVMVIGDLLEKAVAVKREMKLDPHDTTPKELYGSLRERLRQDNTRLANSLHISDADSPHEASPKIVKNFRDTYKDSECFVIKYARIKAILKAVPPKNFMKALHYRSVDSMLKHVHPAQVITVARYTENEEWQTGYAGSLQMLTPSDFETRKLELISIDHEAVVALLEKTLHRHHLVLHAKEIGCVGLVSTRLSKINGFTLRTMSLLVHYAQEVGYFSTLTKVIIGRKDFAQTYCQFLITHQDNHGQIAKRPFHWRALQQAVSRAKIHDVFPPHMVPQDWDHHTANDKLSELNPHVAFWNGIGHVLCGLEEPVSCNIIDVAIDESRQASYEDRSLKYGRRELEQEIISRYVQEPRVHRVLLQRLGL